MVVKKPAKKKTGKSVKSGAKKIPLIAICDDHVQTAVSISQILEHVGYRTLQSYSAVDAIDSCNKQKPDLLILDIRLDGFNGYEVAERLPGQKILFMTGFDINEERVAQFKQAIGIMKKPMDMEELLKIVKKAVGPADHFKI